MSEEKKIKDENVCKDNKCCCEHINEKSIDGSKDTEGSFAQEKEPKIENTSTDVYSNTKKRDKDTNVAVPTEEAVEEAMEWSEQNQR